MSAQAPTISDQIWDMKYRMKEADGTPLDGTVEDTWRRVAGALAAAEEPAQRERYEAEFYEALSDYKFLPAGRITAGAGTGRAVTLFNCFVMGTIPDSMSGIFDMLKEAALTMQQGGGIGYDFSTLRPKGALVEGVAADASGPLPFMDTWDAMCRTIMSAGSRRGAMMATMRCDHPDIFDFIEAKKDATRLRMFNLSVLITDDFMRAVKDDTTWDLVFEGVPCNIVRARELWDAIMQSTYAQAEPGVIFIDRINQTNNLRDIETISATNPCGEQPLPPYGACLLGSINLARLIENAFQSNSGLDSKRLKSLVSTAVRMMDNVVDVSGFPLKAQEDEAKAKRRIGLGVTGLADALAMCGLKYGTDEAAERAELWSRLVAQYAYEASVALAKEKGAYPLFNAENVLSDGTFASGMPGYLKAEISAHGLRNALLTSIAPTGTISLYAGNVSSGVEPIFAYSYDRKVLMPDGSKTEQTVEDYAVEAYRAWWRVNCPVEDRGKTWTDAELPDYFTNAQELTPLEHVKMQAAVQKGVDSSISKTINCPEDISFEDFKEVYMAAWDQGCKGCTTYRPNDITGSVLSVKPSKEEPKPSAEPDAPDVRPDELEGTTYKTKWEGHAIYVTMTDFVDEKTGTRRPFEIFINSKNLDHYAWTVALTRMISAVFRRPHDSRFVVEELKAVFDPKGGAWVKGRYVPSVLAAIGLIIERHMLKIGYLVDLELVTPEQSVGAPESTRVGPSCPACGSFEYVKEAGCEVCKSCGHSKCG